MKQSREELRAEILGEIAEEQALVWQAELEADAKRKTQLLNHDKPEPEPLRVWENMAQKADVFQPGAADLLEYAGRNELGDAELFQAMNEGKYAFDHSQGLHGKWYYCRSSCEVLSIQGERQGMTSSDIQALALDSSLAAAAAASGLGLGGDGRGSPAPKPGSDLFFGRNFAGGLHDTVNRDSRGGHDAGGHHFFEIRNFFHSGSNAFFRNNVFHQLFRLPATSAARSEHSDFHKSSFEVI